MSDATPIDVIEGRAKYSIVCGDCLDVVRTIPDDSIDSMVTDPPAGISFMGAAWDGDKGGRDQWIAWLTERLREAYRVLKPGGYVCIWSLPRTSHWTGKAIEDAGFEVRDTVHHTFGCLSDDTEILVNGNWISYRDVAVGDMAMCYNSVTGTLSWGAIEELFVYDYDDTAFRITGDLTDQIVTREHRCPVERAGRTVFVKAEEAALERSLCVPILEDMSALLSALSVQHQGTGGPQCVLLSQLPGGESKGHENREIQNTECCMRGMRNVVSTEEQDANGESEVLLLQVRRSGSGEEPKDARVAEGDRLHGTRRLDGIQYGELPGQHVRPEEPSVEGRCDVLSETRKLQADQIRALSGGIPEHVATGRICDGAQAGSGDGDRASASEERGRPPYGSQPTEQLDAESDVVPYELGSQAVRASRFTRTDLVRFEPLHYQGNVWCVRVPTGAFVARRNGKAFITGNSGFPKSLNVSLAIDRADGQLETRKVVHSYSAGGNAGNNGGGAHLVGVESVEPVQLAITRGATERSREWDGFGTAMKPGHETWWIARKPFKTTLVENVLKYGCGALNIDACRVSTDWNEPDRPESWKNSGHTADASADKISAPPGDGIQCHPGGRWPANVLFTHSAGCVAVSQSTDTFAVSTPDSQWTKTGLLGIGGPATATATATATAYDCAPDCPVKRLGEQSGDTVSGSGSGSGGIWSESTGAPAAAQHGDSGTSARFFNTFEWQPELDDPFCYFPKPSTPEREAGCNQLRKHSAGEMTGRREDDGAAQDCPRTGAGRGGGRHNHHPTLKSVALMSHLMRLVTRPGGVVLSMFLGSGTDVCAAILSGFRAIGIEKEPEFAEIARARALYWSHNSAPPKKPLPKLNEKQINLFGD